MPTFENFQVLPAMTLVRRYEADPAVPVFVVVPAHELLHPSPCSSETDSRAMQADAVLKIVKKKLKKVHIRIDRQESDHRNLFLAYFELKARLGEEAD